MPQAGEALPFDGSLAWTFVSGERDQFSTVAFYVMHLRGAPDDELAQHVQRAIPVFAETLTRLRLEQTGPPSPAGRIENRGPTQQSQVAGGVTVSRPGCESLLDESLGLGTDD